jgi:hypothetical protein
MLFPLEIKIRLGNVHVERITIQACLMRACFPCPSAFQETGLFSTCEQWQNIPDRIECKKQQKDIKE